jgi:PAS domain S-box-containing protein
MQPDTFIALLHNAGLLALAAILIFAIATRFGLRPGSLRQKAAFGVMLGAASVFVVNMPVPGPLGATFDTRAGPIVLAAFFGGPLGGLIAAAIGAAARWRVGGPAAIGGVVSFFLYIAAGYAFRLVTDRHARREVGLSGYLALALVATAAVLPSFFVGQSFERGTAILARFWSVLLIGNVLGIVMLGLMIERMLAVVSERDRHREAERTATLARRAAAVGVFRYDLRSGTLDVDSVGNETIGGGSGPQQTSIAAYRAAIHPDDIDRVDRAFERARRSGARLDNLRYRIRRPDGGIRYVTAFADFVGGTEGDPDGAIGVAIDVTGEEALRAELALKSLAVDAASCGIVVAASDGDHQLVYVNRHFLDMTGYTREEVMGRNCRFLNEGLGPQAELGELSQALARGETFEGVVRNRRKDGSEFWNRIRISPILDAAGAVTHFMGIQQDITAQVDANQAVIETRDQLRAILASAPDAILTVDSDQRITMFNAAAERLFGWPRDEILGRRVDTLIPAGMRDEHAGLAGGYLGDPAARTGQMAVRARAVTAVRRDASTFPARVSLSRYVHRGRPVVAAITQDMSEIVAANDRMTGLTDRLTEQLRIAKEANDAKTRFLANMSHELRTPLNAILGFSDMLMSMGVERIGPARALEYVRDIHRSGAHLLDLINDVLDLSRIESGALPLAIQAHDPARLIDDALEIVDPIAKARHVEVTRHIDSEARVMCDRRAMQQCLLNLLSNAIKFSEAGGGISVSVTLAPRAARFTISDDGPGIPADVLANIGRPFVRSIHPLVSSQEGTGLGLAITRKLVEGQGGRLEIDSAPGRGTRVTIDLPSGEGDGSAAA